MSVTNANGITQHKSNNTPCAGGGADPRVAFFDRLAPHWDQDGPGQEEIVGRLAALNGRLGLRPGLDVLELGCGTGQITGWLAETVRPGRVVAADFSPGMLAQARARGVDAEFRRLDICADAVASDSFDVVLCLHAFPHFRDPLRALANIRSLLKPGGRLIVLHLAGSAQINAFHSALEHPVCLDLLPATNAWPEMLAVAELELLSLTDEADLFLLTARSV